MGDKVRTVFIGLGRRAMSYARMIGASDRFSIVAVADPDPKFFRHQAHAEIFDGVQLYDDWRRLLEAEEFDLACVCPPDVFHEEIAVEIFNRGKHLILEKPMALTPEGCLRIIEAKQKSDAKLIIGFVLRYNELYKKTRALVQDGAIGRVRAVWVQHSVQLNYFHNWMSERAMSGGLLLQKASHDIDLINWIADATPLKVSAFAGLDAHGGDADNGLLCHECDRRDTCPETRAKDGKAPEVAGQVNRDQILCAYRKGIDVHDNHVVNILYENGIKASYTECHFTPGHRRLFTFIGDEGQVTSDSLGNTVTLARRYSNKSEVFDVNLRAGGHGGGDTGLFADLKRSLFEGGQPIADEHAGFMSILAAEAGERSAAEEGRTIDLSEHLAKYRALVG